MGETINHNDKLSGAKLQGAVRDQIELGLVNSAKIGTIEQGAFLQTVKTHFDEIVPMIDWETPRASGEFKSFPLNFSSALQYAFLKTRKPLLSEQKYTDTESWSQTIKEMMEDDEKLE